jgi:16S rRNA (cytidine1402-2'-O)-methyltransferase
VYNKKMTFGKLFVVGVPIGNWEDMPPRSINYIKLAKNVVVESPYAFSEICKGLNIDYLEKNIISIHFESDGTSNGKMNELLETDNIIKILKSGEDVYLVADEGMPGIADPGAHIVRECIKNKIQISSTAGPSVVVAAAAVTGVMHNFILESFLPFLQEEKIKFLNDKKNHEYPMIIMLRNEKNETEFNDEIPKFLEDACRVWGDKKRVSLCYNLTYPKEFVIHGTMGELLEYFQSNKRNIDDQICMVVH